MWYDADGDRLVLFGGRDSSQFGARNDTWTFQQATGATGEWRLVLAGDTNLGATGADRRSPERRGLAAQAGGGGRVVVVGGQSQCGVLDDGWSLDLQGMLWSSPYRARTGETCARRASASQSCPGECTAPL